MIINLTVKPKSKQDKIIKISDTEYKIHTVKPATNNQANLAILNILSKYLDISKSNIIITKGQKSNHKTLQISGK